MSSSLSAYAFDTRTHVWVSQQVINDIEEDGDLDIPPFYNLPISEDRKNAILSQKESYRLGNIGPDGFPDLLTGQQTTHPGILGGWATDEWLEYIMRKYDGASSKMKAFTLGYLGHASADTFAHTYVNWYAGDAFSLGNGIEEELRHTVIEKTIAEYQPDLVDYQGNAIGNPYQVIGSPDSIPKDELVQSLILDKEVIAQYQKVALTTPLAVSADLYHLIDSLEEDLSSIDAIDWTGAYGELESAVMKLYVYQSTVLVQRVFEEVTHTVCKDEWVSLGSWLNPFWDWKEVCRTVTETLDVTDRVIAEINDEIYALIDQKEEIQSINFWIEAALANWKTGMMSAFKEYEVMSANMARGIMAKEDVAHYLSEWLTCYAPVFAAIPSQLPNSYCYATSAVNDLIDKIKEAETLALVLFPFQYGPASLYQDLRDRVNEEVQKQLIEIAKKEIGEDIIVLLETIKGDISDQGINETFTQFSGGEKGLLSIPDAASRIKKDMALVNGKFDPNNFNTAWNAVQMAKIALLDEAGYAELVQRGGYTLSGYTSKTPLVGFLKSIDGNHQWFEEAPAYPRKAGYLELGELAERAYGYSDAEGGFLLWKNATLRENIFKKVFKGPIAPSLEAAQEKGFERLIPMEHKYRTCHAMPFPDSNEDTQCDVILVLPAIFHLLH